MTALARIKLRGVRGAIAACGGIEGAAASVDKSSSHVGRWNSRTDGDLPGLADAFHLDEVALAATGRAPILQALAAELGHACILLPDCGSGEGALVMTLAEAVSEFGDVAGSITDGLRDGKLNDGERDKITRDIDEAQAALAKLRLIAVGAQVVPLQQREG